MNETELDSLEKVLIKEYKFYNSKSSTNLIDGQDINELHSYELSKLNLKLMEKCKLKKENEKYKPHSIIQECSRIGCNGKEATKRNLKRYKVNVPHLPESLLQEINDVNVCLIRLMQYLRMHFYVSQESEYNDLYYLSNY